VTVPVHEQGDLVRCVATFTVPAGASANAAPVPVDPGVVGFIAHNPQGSLVASAAYNAAASVIRVAAGAYLYHLPIPIASTSIGNWTYGFRATGTLVDATPDMVFEVKLTAL